MWTSKRSLVGKPVLSPHYGGCTTSSVVNDWPRAAIIIVVVVVPPRLLYPSTSGSLAGELDLRFPIFGVRKTAN